MAREIKILEAASENGAGKRGASLGPRAVFLQAREDKCDIFKDRIWETIPNLVLNLQPEFNTPYAKNIENLLPALAEVANHVEATLQDDYFPLILSGDHSNAIGSVSGIRNFFHDEKVGVIWIDAHYDLHSPFTTPSGNIHGMALNALLDKDNLENKINQPAQLTEDYWEKLKKLGNRGICPKIMPDDIVFIGVRDFEKQEAALVEKYGIKTFHPQDIRNLGIAQVLADALEHLSACDHLYISFDVDSQDTSVSMGTGTPVPDGLLPPEAEMVFTTLFHHPKVVAFEITEINPLLDTQNRMAKSVVKLLSCVLQAE
ncbi:MAG: arginase [Bacteroidetes bacterium]|nr:arginase [Bacteroidota bacterium]